jgi:pimeloyl-ACP methyl ester carboxylesterase
VKTLDRAGVRIHYEVRGSGPALLLTHGFSASTAMWAAAAEELARTHTVITWDIRGHGASDYPADPALYSVPLAVGDMAALLDAVGARRAVVAGHSLGGFLSLEFRLANPERVAALVLIDTGPGYRSDAPRAVWNERIEKMAAAFERKGLAALGDGAEVRAATHRDATGLARAARGILAQRDGRVVESLPKIAVPTLVLVGEHDEAFLAGSRYMAEKIPGAELAVIPGAGHSPNLSKPVEFHRALEGFLSRSASAGSRG